MNYHLPCDTVVAITGVIATLAWHVGFHRGVHVGHKRAVESSEKQRWQDAATLASMVNPN